MERGLADGEQGIGFYRVTAGTALAAGRAYLTIHVDKAKSFYGIDFNDATAIRPIKGEQGTIKVHKQGSTIFNLRGQRLSDSSQPRGIVILNNKMMVNK